MKQGTFVVGEFVGVEHGDWPRLLVRTGLPSSERDGYVERLEFSPFDALSGVPVLPADVHEGDTVSVRVIQTARLSAAGKPFIAKRAVAVELLGAVDAIA